MALQQLDLFGNPIPQQVPKTKVKQVREVPAVPEKETPVKNEEPRPRVETVYDSIVKRKRGRPRKTTKDAIPKVKAKRGRKPYNEVFVKVDLTNVPEDDILKEKLYHPIGEVARWFGITISQLRAWENEFDILQPRKNKKGDRLFRFEDIQNLKTIYYLLRNKKLGIEAAKDYLKANRHKTDTQVQLKESLLNFKTFLLEIKAGL